MLNKIIQTIALGIVGTGTTILVKTFLKKNREENINDESEADISKENIDDEFEKDIDKENLSDKFKDDISNARSMLDFHTDELKKYPYIYTKMILEVCKPKKWVDSIERKEKYIKDIIKQNLDYENKELLEDLVAIRDHADSSKKQLGLMSEREYTEKEIRQLIYEAACQKVEEAIINNITIGNSH